MIDDKGVAEQSQRILDSIEKQIELAEGVSSESWKELISAARANYEQRMLKQPNVGFETITTTESSNEAEPNYLKRVRLLKSDDGLWYSTISSSGEAAIRITKDLAIRAERPAGSISRTSFKITSEAEKYGARKLVDLAMQDWFLQADLFRELKLMLGNDASWKLTELSDGGTTGDWKLQLTSSADPQTVVQITVAPQNGYCVSEIRRKDGNNTLQLNRKLALFDGDFVVEQEKRVNGDSRSALDASELMTTSTIMNSQKQSSFREELAYMSLKQEGEVSNNLQPGYLGMVRMIVMALLAFSLLSVLALVWR